MELFTWMHVSLLIEKKKTKNKKTTNWNFERRANLISKLYIQLHIKSTQGINLLF